MGFSRQDYWSGSPFPSPRDRPNPQINPRSPAFQADFFFYHLSHQGSPVGDLEISGVKPLDDGGVVRQERKGLDTLALKSYWAGQRDLLDVLDLGF